VLLSCVVLGCASYALDADFTEAAVEIENTFYIGYATVGKFAGNYFYIGTANTSSDTPDSVFSIPGYELQTGTDWDNTPEWAPEWYLSNYKIMKHGEPVLLSDLPDYRGPGGRNNRRQHYIFSIR
jgi:hypothetical protein